MKKKMETATHFKQMRFTMPFSRKSGKQKQKQKTQKKHSELDIALRYQNAVTAFCRTSEGLRGKIGPYILRGLILNEAPSRGAQVQLG